MFGKTFHLFTVWGFKVRADSSWFVLILLILWSLAKGYFPSRIDNLALETAVWLALAGAIGLFASIVFHEFCHAFVARQFGMPISGITLFLFGGVAQLRDEPPNAKAEFFVAIVGPIASYGLAGIFYLLLRMLPVDGRIAPLNELLAYLMTINLVLATFNLLPAFPLDGGRVLRALIWSATGRLHHATRITTALGRGLGMGLAFLGVINIIAGQFAAGIWFVLIGFFIVSAARSSEAQSELKVSVEGVRVQDIMNTDVITVPADITVSELVERYFYRYFHKSFPVMRGNWLLGCVRLEDVGHLPARSWDTTRVAELLSDRNRTQFIEPEAPVWKAICRMNEKNVSRLLVVDHGELKGVFTMRDLMQFLAVRRELSDWPGGKNVQPRYARSNVS